VNNNEGHAIRQIAVIAVSDRQFQEWVSCLPGMKKRNRLTAEGEGWRAFHIYSPSFDPKARGIVYSEIVILSGYGVYDTLEPLIKKLIFNMLPLTVSV
jgi:hypothetical protein